MTRTKHWAEELIGLPWSAGARGPNEFDCWGLLWHVYRTQYNIDLALYPVDPHNTIEVARNFKAAMASDLWIELDEPREGCAVGMSTSHQIHHVGIWLDLNGGVVLHARNNCKVTAQGLRGLAQSGISRTVYYQHKDYGLNHTY